MADAVRDNNNVPSLLGVSSSDLVTPTRIAANPTTKALLIDSTSLYSGLDTRYLKLDTSNDPLTGDLLFSGSQKIIGGTSTTADLTLQTTSGVGTTGADMHFLVGNNGATEAMTILNSGSVGIGTTAPGAKLMIDGSADDEQLIVQAHSTQTANILEIQNSSATPLVVVSGAGTVGIGTTAPVGILHLYKAAAASRLAIDGDAGQNRLISYRTGALQRFGLYVNNTAESGSNAGSNFAIRAYSDAGTLLSTPFFINRATGNVGIGTTSPGYKLQVNDSTADGMAGRFIQTSTSGSPFGIYSQAAGASTQNTAIYGAASGATTNIGVLADVASGSNNFAFFASNTAKSYFAGDVGIGMTSPETKLDVGGALTVRNLIYFGASASRRGYFTWDGGVANTLNMLGASGKAISFGTNDTYDLVYISTSGNVGIGTTAPTGKLHIYSNVNTTLSNLVANPNTGGSAYAQFRIQTIGSSNALLVGIAGTGVSGTGLYGGNRGYVGSEGSVAGVDFYAAAGNMRFFTGGVGAGNERMQVTSTGNVGIGTTAPAGKLEVLGASAAIFTRAVDGAGAPDSAIQIGLSETTATVGGGPSFLFFGNNSAGTKSFTGRMSSVWENVTAGSEAAGITFSTRANTGDTTASTERMRITSAGNVGIGTTAPTNLLSLGGNSARTFWMERHTTANTAGNTLTITAGGATSGATNKAGGNLILQGGLSTGSAESGVILQGVVAGASGTSDRTQTTEIQVLGNKIGLFGVTPVIQPAAANQAALTNSTTGSYDGTLADVGVVFSQAVINNNFTDVYTLLTEIRTALVNVGIIKGSA